MRKSSPHVATPGGRLRRASTVRLRQFPMLRSPAFMQCHACATQACVDGCDATRITETSVAYVDNGVVTHGASCARGDRLCLCRDHVGPDAAAW
eukprot:2077724-Pleurochrysis_carterae.AAC.1